MKLHIIDEAERCLKCKNPLCQKGCPIHTPIPQITQLFMENKLMDAGKILFENNPMSVVCSTVCNHESQCEGHCILGRKSSPIHFSSIENFISDAYLDRMEIPEIEKKNQKAAVIGAGPAGITVAIKLALNGYDVTVFEERSKIGGVLQYGIPEFRLSKTVLTRYKKLMEKLGIQIRPNTVIGSALVIDNLFRDGYSSIFVGTGVWRPKTIGIQGESLGNVYFGIDYLRRPEAHILGEKVAVIGVGNVAMDVARTALRNGAKEVTLYARGKNVSASSQEIAYTRLEGAEFAFGMAIDSINEKGPLFKISKFDENDKIIGYEEELKQEEADATIICVSQAPKNKLVLTTERLKSSEKGLLLTDENCMTTCEGVFAAGDVVQGANTVVHAVEEAKRAAQGMIEYMEKLKK